MSASPKRKFVTKMEESRSLAALSADSQAEDTVQSIKHFLHDNSPGHRKERVCNICGTALAFFDTYCWLDGAEVASILELPFCPSCNPDVLTALRRRGAPRDSHPLD